MSKVDPEHLTKLDRRSTILLQASREHTAGMDEKDVLAIEDPGMDTLRGSFGTVGSIIRARSARRMSMSRGGGGGGSRPGSQSARPPGAMAPYDPPRGPSYLSTRSSANNEYYNGLQRHQLYDAPVPLGSPSIHPDDVSSVHSADQTMQMMNKRPTIKFDTKDVVHQYHPTGTTPGSTNDPGAIHGQRISSPNNPISRLNSDSYPPSLSMTAAVSAANPASRDLLSESPTDTEHPSSALSQILSLPPLPARTPGLEGLPYSAPPTQFVPRANPGRKDSREIFDNNNTPSSALLSFPSVTDSARSVDNDTDSNHSRGRAAKRYPKGDRDADREESVSLWQREGGDEDDDDASRLAGIRLVTKGGSTRF